MHSTLSPHDRAAAVLFLGLVAAIVVFAVVSVATAVVLIGKGGAMALGVVSQSWQQVSAGPSSR